MLKFLTILKVGLEGDRAQQDAVDPDGARDHHRRGLRDCDDRRRAGIAGGDPVADLGARSQFHDDLPGGGDAVGRPHLHRAVHADRGRRGGRQGRVPLGGLRVAVLALGRPDRRGEPQLGHAGPGRRRRMALRPLLERRQGGLLRRVGGPGGGEGVRSGNDGRQRALRGPGSGRADGSHQELSVSGRGGARDQGRERHGSGPGRHRRGALHDGDAAPEAHAQDRHVHGLGGVPRGRRRGAARDRVAAAAAASDRSRARTPTS